MSKKEQQIKTNEQFQQEFDDSVKVFHETYPDIYKYSSDRNVSACLVSMLDKYKMIFPESKPEKKEDIIKSVDILTKFVKKYKPHIAYSIFDDKEYLKQRKLLFKKGQKLLKKEFAELKQQQKANHLDNLMSK